MFNIFLIDWHSIKFVLIVVNFEKNGKQMFNNNFDDKTKTGNAWIKWLFPFIAAWIFYWKQQFPHFIIKHFCCCFFSFCCFWCFDWICHRKLVCNHFRFLTTLLIVCLLTTIDKCFPQQLTIVHTPTKIHTRRSRNY